MKFKISRFISTFFYVGLCPICPGTVGSIAVLPFWFLILIIISNFGFNFVYFNALLILFIYIIGHYSTKNYIETTKKDDPHEVVIDEVVGQLLSFSLSFLTFIFAKNSFINFLKNETAFASIMLFIMPIVLFRIYDIKKPWIIGRIDKNVKGATGIMLDDAVGGVFAAITNSILILIILQLI